MDLKGVLAMIFQCWMYTWMKKCLLIKAQLLNTFKDHLIVETLSPTAKNDDEWLLSNTFGYRFTTIMVNTNQNQANTFRCTIAN